VEKLIGAVLGDGRYRIDRKLGSGGQGTVYKGMHLALNMPVAIKVLPASASEDRTSRTRFVREARRAANLQHPHIVHVFDYAYGEGIYYIVSEFIEGTDLKKLIQASGGPVPIDKALRYTREVGEALQFAHDREIIHRDIKPANILIDSQTERAALCDFGLARMIEGDVLEVTSERGGMPGTPAYMSPEQCQGIRLDQRTDIYSLGLVVYEMLTGQNPFRGEHDTTASIIYKQVNERPPAAGSLNPRLNRQVDEVLFKALTKDRNQRYQSVTQFVNDLDEAIQGKVKPASSAQRRKAFAIPPWIALALAGVAIIIVMAVVPGPRSYLVDWSKKLLGRATATLVVAPPTPPTSVAREGKDVSGPVTAPSPTAVARPTETPQPPRAEEAPIEGTLGSDFVEDVTIPDGTMLRPGEPFVKVWRIRNSGLRPWPSGVHLVHVDGHPMGEEVSPPLEREVSPGEEVEIELPLVAPEEPGEYGSLWQLRIPEGGVFGTELRVVVEVVLFHDDFSDRDSGWLRGGAQRVGFDYRDGEYLIMLGMPGRLWRALAPIEMLADFVLEVDVELLGEPSPAVFGVVFRHQDEHNTYGFLIRNNGQYGLWKRVDDEPHPIGGPEWTSSPHIRRTGRNRLRVVCEGPHIALFANDQHLRTVTDEAFPEGRVGLCASLGTGSKPIEVAFDNVIVRLP